jgi:hypothetical protein
MLVKYMPLANKIVCLESDLNAEPSNQKASEQQITGK